ncbi:MAG: CPBP family intramembrane metalloprotease [Lachnospiraceae bacterium]|nr:CPBP family intramembrane metalloprotease [Lachnospiraceae bacterium]
MSPKTVRILYKKEMLDVFRDKKTVLVMLLLPMILYPVMYVAIMLISSFIARTDAVAQYFISYEGEMPGAMIEGLEEASENRIVFLPFDDPEKALKEQQIDAYVTVEEEGAQTRLNVHYLSEDSDSDHAADEVLQAASDYGRTLSEEEIRQAGLNVDAVLYPLQTEATDLSSTESMVGSVMGTAMPILLMTFVMLAAFYPAIDTTSGERERGTMEFLLTMPVSNLELVTAKYLAVATIAVASTLLNVIAIAMLVAYIGSLALMGADTAPGLNLAAYVPVVFVLIICVFAFALLISAISMCIAAFAKSYKEANNYITPFMLVVMFTGYIAYIPDITLTGTMSIVPIANICLLIKDVLVFKFHPVLIALVFLSNLLYAGIAVYFLSKIYRSERILFGEGGSGVQFFESRKNIKKGTMPTPPEAFIVFLFMIILMFYLGTVLSLRSAFTGTIIMQFVYVALTLFALWYIRADMRAVYALRAPHRGRMFAGGVLLGIGAFALAQFMGYWLSRLLPSSMEAVGDQFDQILSGVPFIQVFLAVAVIPAICEELVFRGYFYTAFAGKMKALSAVLLTTFLFALFHWSMIRFLPVFFIGLLCTWARHQSGSIFPAMLIHFINNGTVLVLSELAGDSAEAEIGFAVQAVYLAVALVTIFAGGRLMGTRQASPGTQNGERN